LYKNLTKRKQKRRRKEDLRKIESHSRHPKKGREYRRGDSIIRGTHRERERERERKRREKNRNRNRENGGVGEGWEYGYGEGGVAGTWWGDSASTSLRRTCDIVEE
jgi:hypothetical protein